MKTIWKFKVNPGSSWVALPSGAQFLTVQEQRGLAQMWWLIDESAPKETRRFAVYGTGYAVPQDPGTYLGSFQLGNGALVFHLFEER